MHKKTITNIFIQSSGNRSESYCCATKSTILFVSLVNNKDYEEFELSSNFRANLMHFKILFVSTHIFDFVALGVSVVPFSPARITMKA